MIQSNEAAEDVEDAEGTAAQARSHLDLLRWAGELQQQALAHDVPAVHVRLSLLRDALAAQQLDGSTFLEGLSPAAAGTVRATQARLLTRVEALVEVSAREPHDCRCIEETARLTGELRRQARLETRLGSGAR